MKRASTTLMICALAGGAAVVGLARPATNTSTAAIAPAAVAEANGDETGDDPYGDGGQTENESPASDAAPAAVTIEDFAFGGTTVAKPGQTINVENLDSAPHTMTARDGTFDSGTIDGGGNTGLTLPVEPGSYEFFCAIHPSMVASITVQA